MLCVSKINLSSDFIKRVYFDTAEGSGAYRYLDLWLEGFPLFDRVDDQHLISLTENEKHIVAVHYETTHSALYIDCHNAEYSEEKLVQALTRAAQKHGKKLEVNI